MSETPLERQRRIAPRDNAETREEIMDESNYCIVRTTSAGVFAGNLTDRDGKEGRVENARRLWYWSGAASLSQLARDGVKNPKQCKFPCAVEWVLLTEIIEILPVTEAAKQSIAEVPVWAE